MTTSRKIHINLEEDFNFTAKYANEIIIHSSSNLAEVMVATAKFITDNNITNIEITFNV